MVLGRAQEMANKLVPDRLYLVPNLRQFALRDLIKSSVIKPRPAVQSEQHQNDAGELMRQQRVGPVSLIVDRSSTTTARIDPDPSFFDAR
jgi:hypothetical protein